MSGPLNKIWTVVPNEIEKEKLQPGNHIYTLTRANTKYHAIYLDDENVIHFPQGRQGSRSNDQSKCPKCGDRDQSSFHGVVSSCIDCFLSFGDHLYLFEYGVNPALFLFKLGGRTTLASSDPAEVVQNRASNFLQMNNNDSARCFGLYCLCRFGSDIAARPNVIKVDQVQTLPDVDEKLSSAASGFRPIQSLIDLFIVLLMAYFNFWLLRRVMWSDTLQLLSETPPGVLTLACIIFFYSAVLQRRLLSNKIHKKQLKHGDHIYTWRRNFCSIYAHHGYVW